MNNMMKENFKSAAFAEDFSHIIDAYGNRIEFDDPRIEHIWPFQKGSINAIPFLTSIFEKRGWRIRFLESTSDLMYYSKLLCTGRECPSLNMFSGMYYEDIVKNYLKDDIFIYWGIEDVDTCQLGAWPDAWEVFSASIGNPNAIYSAFSTLESNYLGQGLEFGKDILTAFILGDLLDEAEWALKTIAQNTEEALKIFKAETMKVVPNLHKGIEALENSLEEWASNIRKIPLKASLEETPKILLFSGGNLILLREPLMQYCYQQEIIPKFVGFHEFVLYLLTGAARDFGFMCGYDNFEQQFNLGSVISSSFNPKLNPQETNLAMSACFTLELADFLNQRLRKAMQGSGIVYDEYVSYENILKEGHPYINDNIYSEVGVVVGKYLTSIKTGVFDGLVNVAWVTCHQSMNGQSFVRAISHQYDIPYTGLEMEGPWLLGNHHRLLENVVIQARRLRKGKNGNLNKYVG